MDERVRREVWTRAAGRCVICNEWLLTDHLDSPDAIRLIGEVAHNAARSIDGPRGRSTFHCPVTDESLLNAVGNQDLHDTLVAFWQAHALGAFVVGIGGLPAPLGLPAIPRALGVDEAAYMLAVQLAEDGLSATASTFAASTNLGFAPVLMPPLWSVATLDGVCAL